MRKIRSALALGLATALVALQPAFAQERSLPLLLPTKPAPGSPDPISAGFAARGNPATGAAYVECLNGCSGGGGGTPTGTAGSPTPSVVSVQGAGGTPVPIAFPTVPTFNVGTTAGLALSSDITALKNALGAPLQAGGNVGLTGTLPNFATTPTFNLGTLNGAATAANQASQLTAQQAVASAAAAAGATAPANVMQVGGQDGSGKLQPASATTPLPVAVISGGGANASVATNEGAAAASSTQTGSVDANGVLHADGDNNPHPVKDASRAQVLAFFTEGGKGAVAVGQTTSGDRFTTSAGGDFAIECFNRAPANWNGATFTLQWVAADGLTVADTAITCNANTGLSPIVVTIPAKSTVLGKLTGAATGSPASGINVVARFRSN